MPGCGPAHRGELPVRAAGKYGLGSLVGGGMKGMIERARAWRPSSAHGIALLALFIALGGSAVALRGKNSVGPDDIRRGAVKTKKIANFAVNPFKANLGRFGFS